MFKYKKFLVRDTDRFDPYSFPKVQSELEAIMIETSFLPKNNKAEMLLSFFQDQPLKDEWVNSNPRVVDFINSKQGGKNSIKELFDSSNNNRHFTEELEQYVREQVG